jgi:hypothetical protein
MGSDCDVLLWFLPLARKEFKAFVSTDVVRQLGLQQWCCARQYSPLDKCELIIRKWRRLATITRRPREELSSFNCGEAGREPTCG